jgi:ATP-dependent exoDNAse (exonuclease V) alpha subunit
MQETFKNKIVLVDEASMISTNQMKDLFTISRELEFKLILIGDRRQLDSVEARYPKFNTLSPFLN